jgi:hypothetical protein
MRRAEEKEEASGVYELMNERGGGGDVGSRTTTCLLSRDKWQCDRRVLHTDPQPLSVILNCQ